MTSASAGSGSAISISGFEPPNVKVRWLIPVAPCSTSFVRAIRIRSARDMPISSTS